MTWSPERRATLIGVALVVEGILSVRIGFASFEQRQAAMTLLTGWFVAGCGLLAWLQVPSSRTGPLLVAAAAAWFIGGFRWVDVDAVSTVAGTLAWLFAAVAAHAVLTFPEGRSRGLATTVAIVGAYLVSIVPPWLGPTLVAVVVVVGLAVGRPVRRLDRAHRRHSAVLVGFVFSIALVVGQGIPVVVPAGARFDGRILAQLGLMVVALGLAGTLLRESKRRARVTDLVVELDPSRVGLGRELAAAVGDPTLEVGYWLPESERFVDAAGRRLQPPGPGSARRSTLIERDGRPVAILIHDPLVTADPAVHDATARAAWLATVNARLQADVSAQAIDVDASRRRILDAADVERRDLEVRLREQVEPTLARLEAAIDAASTGPSSPDLELDQAREQLRLVRLDLAGITEDLHPRILDELGLRGALEAAAARSPVPVTLTWDADEALGPMVESALYFVCSEALANVAKHADARHVHVWVHRGPDDLTLEVEDDGRGGARIDDGTGLHGLQDRLATVGGRLAIRTPASGGTCVVAIIPIRSEA